eukprot:7160876-Karenia_brevis.AAC.1
MQGVGPQPRATAGMDYNQKETWCSTFWASLCAVQHQMECLPALDMEAPDQDPVQAMGSTSTARMVQKEFNTIGMAHMARAATEFQIYN